MTSQLSGGASAAYLALYAVGIETWRVMVMLAIEGRITAQRMVQLIDTDKGAISRTFKAMHEQGLLRFEPDAHDRRIRHAVMTAKGRALHDRIIQLALLREQTALSVLDETEVAQRRDMLRRVYVNLPAVEVATQAFIRRERAALGMEPRWSGTAPPRPHGGGGPRRKRRLEAGLGKEAADFVTMTTPVAVPRTTRMHSTSVSVKTVRLGRCIAGCRNARALLSRVPVRWLTSQTPKPSCVAPLKSSLRLCPSCTAASMKRRVSGLTARGCCTSSSPLRPCRRASPPARRSWRLNAGSTSSKPQPSLPRSRQWS